MRPDILNPLFRPVTSLAGIGPKLGTALRRLVGGAEDDEPPRVVDLLFHLPVGIIDRRNQPGIALSPEGAIVTLKVRIDRHQKPPPRNRRTSAGMRGGARRKIFCRPCEGRCLEGARRRRTSRPATAVPAPARHPRRRG